MDAPYGYVRLLATKQALGYLEPYLDSPDFIADGSEADYFDEFSSNENDIDDLTLPDAKNWTTQARVPAGTSAGGQFGSSGGGSAGAGAGAGEAGAPGGAGGEAGGRAGMGDIGIDAKTAQGFQGGSAGAHIVQDADGNFSFTPERQALHDAIIRAELSGVPVSTDPTFTVMGGGPASGKTTLITKGIVEDIPQGKKAAQVNADLMKEQLPEWKSMGNDTAKAGFVHEESSYLAKRLTAAAIQRKTDVVLDGTGDSSPQSMEKKISGAKQAGYKVNGVYVTQPTELALQGALARGAKTGRYVNERVIIETHKGVSQTFPKIVGQFDSVKLYETRDMFTTGKAKLLGQGEKGKFTVVDKAGYQEFLDKGN